MSQATLTDHGDKKQIFYNVVAAFQSHGGFPKPGCPDVSLDDGSRTVSSRRCTVTRRRPGAAGAGKIGCCDWRVLKNNH